MSTKQSFSSTEDRDEKLLSLFTGQETAGYSRGETVCSGAFTSKNQLLFMPGRPCHGYMSALGVYTYGDGSSVPKNTEYVYTSLSLGYDEDGFCDRDFGGRDSDLDFCECSASKVLSIEKASAWWNFILDGKRSPWRMDGQVIKGNDGRPLYARIKIDDDTNSSVLVGLLIATRQTIEHPSTIELWNAAVKEGFTPLEALAISSFGGLSNKDNTVHSINHQHFLFSRSGSNWECFRDRSLNTDLTKFRNGDAYGSIFRLFISNEAKVMNRDKYLIIPGEDKKEVLIYNGPFKKKLIKNMYLNADGTPCEKLELSYFWPASVKYLKENRSVLFPDN